MVNFSKKLTKDQIPGWEEYVKLLHFCYQLESAPLLICLLLVLKHRLSAHRRYYFNYRLLKARVKVYTEQTKQGNHDQRRVLKDFSKLLDDEVLTCLIARLKLLF